MNAVMSGMIPVMVILMTHNMDAMEPTSIRFWGTMSLASLVGLVIAYPVNWWLVAAGLKHGMGTVRVLGRGGQAVAAELDGIVATSGDQAAVGDSSSHTADHAEAGATAHHRMRDT